MNYVFEEGVVRDAVGQPIKKGDQVVHVQSGWKSSSVYYSVGKVLHAGIKRYNRGGSSEDIQIKKEGGLTSWVTAGRVIAIRRNKIKREKEDQL